MFYNGKRTILVGVLFVLLIAAAALVYYRFYYTENLNQPLPITVTPEETDRKQEDIAYRLWFAYMDKYKGEGVSSWKRLADVRYDDFQLLVEKGDEFSVRASFWVKLDKGKWSTHHSWGQVKEDGRIENIHWLLKIKQTAQSEYTLFEIEDISSQVGDLPSVERTSERGAETGKSDEKYSCKIENDELEITYNFGANWRKVPISAEELFEGDYTGPRDEPMDHSYSITPKRTAFIVGDGDKLRIVQSNDEGKTWNSAPVNVPFQGLRMRIIDFVSADTGFLILTGGRTMTSEGTFIFKTTDNGTTWEEVGLHPSERLATGGGFIDEQLGFTSFGGISRNDAPQVPDLYRTGDGGKTWTEIEVPIPEEHKGVFTTALTPSFDGTKGTLLVKQGENGDYLGGNTMAEFTSEDAGKTWSFVKLNEPGEEGAE